MNHELLKEIWNSVYDQKLNTEEVINKYFHKNYEQCINGVIMNLTEYIQHVISQRHNMNIDFVEYKNILENGNDLFAIYYPKGKNKNNQAIEAEVIAYFCFENKKLLRIHGQVRLIEGNLSDIDM